MTKKIHMNKYIEELEPGSMFVYDNSVYLLTVDFKKDNSRLAYNIHNGNPRWLRSNLIIEPTEIYTLDKDNNTIPLKRESSLYENNKTINY